MTLLTKSVSFQISKRFNSVKVYDCQNLVYDIVFDTMYMCLLDW